MTRNFVFAMLVLAAAAATLAGQEPTFRSTGDAVSVFVTVTDDDGRLVTSLTRDDFEIRDEGRPQPITLFDNSPQPIRLVVMLDVSGSMAGNLPLLLEASGQLFSRLLPDDAVRVGTFGREVAISPVFTRDPETLRTSLPAAIDPEAPTPLWMALDEAIGVLVDQQAGRRVVLVLSDGHDTGTGGFRFGMVSQIEVIDRAREEDVMIYGVGMRSRSSGSMMGPGGIGIAGLRRRLTADLPDPGLARVAEETGGGYVEIRLGQDLAAAFARVADERHGQYLLGFAPPERDGEVHEIDVRTPGRDLEPRARRDYVAPEE